jgi:hypothetical protein
MPQLSIFISCVSNEFGHYRDAIRRDFSRPNLTTKIQEDFIAYGASTLQKLDEYIQNCEAVIHICGNMTGSMANALSLEYINDTYKDFGTHFPELVAVLEGREQLSYTQWEAWLAPDPIPESLLGVQAAEDDSFDYITALTKLSEYSLVNRLDTPEFTVHRLVQDVTR